VVLRQNLTQARRRAAVLALLDLGLQCLDLEVLVVDLRVQVLDLLGQVGARLGVVLLGLRHGHDDRLVLTLLVGLLALAAALLGRRGQVGRQVAQLLLERVDLVVLLDQPRGKHLVDGNDVLVQVLE